MEEVVSEPVEQQEVEVSQDVIEQPKTYSQEEVEALQAKIDELIQYKPHEKSEQELALEAQAIELSDKQAKLWQRQVEVELKELGLQDFAEFVQVVVDDLDGLQGKVAQLKRILGERELKSSFKPNEHRNADTYSIAEKQKDTKGMIGLKLSNIWK